MDRLTYSKKSKREIYTERISKQVCECARMFPSRASPPTALGRQTDRQTQIERPPSRPLLIPTCAWHRTPVKDEQDQHPERERPSRKRGNKNGRRETGEEKRGRETGEEKWGKRNGGE